MFLLYWFKKDFNNKYFSDGAIPNFIDSDSYNIDF